MPRKANSKVQTKQKTKALQYVAGDLVRKHWPTWDIHAKVTEVVENWHWIQNVRYKVDDYDTKLDAFRVDFTEYSNTTTATTTTRIYIPAIYRPIFRLLQSKLCWHQIACSIPEPTLKRNASENEYTDFLVRKGRYEVWRDGAMRNIIYCNSIREGFFHWIEDTYYSGNSATGILPSETKMSRDERCLLIENWMMHELLIRGHTDTEVNVWMSDKRNVKLWEKTGDVFGLSEYVRHRTNLDVNVLQTGINMAKNSPGMAARWIKTIPTTSLSYNSKPSRRSNGSPSRRTSIKSDVRTLPSSRSFSIKSWTINSIVLLLYVSIPFHIVSSYPFLFY